MLATTFAFALVLSPATLDGAGPSADRTSPESVRCGSREADTFEAANDGDGFYFDSSESGLATVGSVDLDGDGEDEIVIVYPCAGIGCVWEGIDVDGDGDDDIILVPYEPELPPDSLPGAGSDPVEAW